MKTRCKFTCDSVTTYGNGYKDASFTPVMSGSEENKSFWAASPSGSFKLGYVNPNVTFEPGKEYYIDITKSENNT